MSFPITCPSFLIPFMFHGMLLYRAENYISQASLPFNLGESFGQGVTPAKERMVGRWSQEFSPFCLGSFCTSSSVSPVALAPSDRPPFQCLQGSPVFRCLFRSEVGGASVVANHCYLFFPSWSILHSSITNVISSTHCISFS